MSMHSCSDEKGLSDANGSGWRIAYAASQPISPEGRAAPRRTISGTKTDNVHGGGMAEGDTVVYVYVCR